MRPIAFWTGIAVIAAGCTQAPVTKPRILSVQTPQGMPGPPSLKTSRNAPLIVPTAPVGARQAVVAPMIVNPAPQPPPGMIAPPAGALVPAVPGGAQGVMAPNTIGQPPLQYQPPAGANLAVPGSSSLKAPEKLPGPVSDSSETQKSDDR